MNSRPGTLLSQLRPGATEEEKEVRGEEEEEDDDNEGLEGKVLE